MWHTGCLKWWYSNTPSSIFKAPGWCFNCLPMKRGESLVHLFMQYKVLFEAWKHWFFLMSGPHKLFLLTSLLQNTPVSQDKKRTPRWQLKYLLMSPGTVPTCTRAAKAPEDVGLSAPSPWISAVLGGAIADDAAVSDCVGSAGCIRLSSRQVSSTLYSMSTRQWRFLELYSTRLISRPRPWYTGYKNKTRVQTYTSYLQLRGVVSSCSRAPYQYSHVKALLLGDVAGNSKDAIQSSSY